MEQAGIPAQITGTLKAEIPMTGFNFQWRPENHQVLFPGTEEVNWVASIQACLDHEENTLTQCEFTDIYPVRFLENPRAHRLVPRENMQVWGHGDQTGLVLMDNDPFVNSQVSWRFWGTTGAHDRVDGVWMWNFSMDSGSQPSHNTTISFFSAVGANSALRKLRCIGPRAGNNHECFALSNPGATQDRSVQEWSRHTPDQFSVIKDCRVEKALPNKDANFGDHVWEITAFRGDMVIDNFAWIDQNDDQVAPQHLFTLEAYNGAVGTGNRAQGENFDTLDWNQWPPGFDQDGVAKRNIFKNRTVYDNHFIR